MSKRRMAAVVLVTAVLIICQIFPVKAADDENLYALSAVLMDGENGRVLYGKEAYKGRPNASTTKVMTCILALELAKGDDYVQVSGNAASQPQTRLGMREGQQFYLEDLLYSLMLKSHNDSAVAIAEHIGGSVEGFAEKMNEKAKELGCKDTHFVTPNGLDGEDEGGIHHTTARDLALIMAYAIKNATFVHITQTRDYTFTDISGKKHYSVHNTNAFLDMETGVISGKTGFTGNAGYCYVCAVRQDERLFIVALLGCGWPGNKNYKWSDTKKLLSYGRENYQYVMLPELPQLTAENVQALTVAAGDVSFTLTPAEGAWTADGRDVTDQLADLTAWLGDMHLAACVDWRPSAGAAALCGLDQPGAVLTAEYTHNGVQHSFTLTVGGQRGAGYCVTVSDDDTIYLMSAEALAPLLALAQSGLA